jgi:hypothetical protein
MLLTEETSMADATASTTSTPPAAAALFRMMTGYWVSQSVYIAAKLGVADLLHAGPKHYEELAAGALSGASPSDRSAPATRL